MTGARSKAARKNTGEALKPADDRLIDLVLFSCLLKNRLFFFNFFFENLLFPVLVEFRGDQSVWFSWFNLKKIDLTNQYHYITD